jgi:hypothetical protein
MRLEGKNDRTKILEVMGDPSCTSNETRARVKYMIYALNLLLTTAIFIISHHASRITNNASPELTNSTVSI